MFLTSKSYPLLTTKDTFTVIFLDAGTLQETSVNGYTVWFIAL